MKKLLLMYHIILFSAILIHCEPANCQTQGEQEVKWAKELFANSYKPQQYKRYELPLHVKGDIYTYKDVAITVAPKPELRTFFDSGIFYPDIFQQSFKYEPPLQINKDTLAAWRKRNIELKEPATPYTQLGLSILHFEELQYPELAPTRKRFKMMVFYHLSANSTIYFLELTNNNATDKTNTLEFIKGASLTFFKQGWVQI
ncbi:hypothetical protein IDJ77_10945 [Mucilaginibacter sp. ZT4R22]|uniref:Lipoprotein n=1 Tax=Mucilaginibacter pankratovii TaxID=2772110 RepID=A0ABR7WQ54_9SPHI|nr:hypothetical protein [Mucilaginibacter pankratovii]MBD1364326.1 hypothetical protein [Mucilaginibacter pankratovii]